MSKRKINVEKLSDEQLARAEQIIIETINNHINHLSSKWNTELATYGKSCEVNIVIDTEQKIKEQEGSYTDDMDSIVEPSSELKPVAEDLRRIADTMKQDINSTVSACNKLLNRYGMACLIGVSEQVISS